MKTKHQTIGYLRVSTSDQNLEKNRAEILAYANDQDLGKVEFVEEKVSGTVSWKKRKLSEVIERLTEGDTIIVSELSRIGRSMLEIMEVLKICLERGIHIHAIKGNWRLDNSIQSKVIAMVFTIASEIERDLISLRTKEALKARKVKGLPLGRPKGKGKSKLDQYRPEIEALLNNGSTQKFIANRYGTTEANFTNWMNKNNINRLII